MDKLDLKILGLLQRDGALTAADVAERVGLSKAPCWRRIEKLKKAGVIRKTVALVEPGAVNVGTTVFVHVRTGDHSAEWFDCFAKAVRDIPEVVELYRLSGDVDYLMRVCVPNIDAYDAVYKRLISRCRFSDVSASFALETIKATTELPLEYAR